MLLHAPILNKIESELKDSRPVKTIKKERTRFYCFISCSVEVTLIITTLILENMFGVIINLRGNSGTAIMHVCRCSISAVVRYLFIHLLYLKLEQS